MPENKPHFTANTKKTTFRSEECKHRTDRGDWVRSKSEVIIANTLHQLNVDYHYELPLEGSRISGNSIPDFTFFDKKNRPIIWEHLGMLHNPSYASKWDEKHEWYKQNQFVEGNNLFITRDDAEGGLDSQRIRKIAADIKYLVQGNVQESFIVLDFETTGLAPRNGARATEVAAVLVENGQITKKFQSLMNAGVYIPQNIQEITGITDAMIRRAPPSTKVMREFYNFIGDTPLVAHNASFDQAFLDAELKQVGLQVRQPIICSMRIARRVYQKAPDHKLGTLVHYANIDTNGVFHRALADAEMTTKLMLKMISEIQRSHNLTEVHYELLQQLQEIPKNKVEDWLRRFC